MNDRTVNRVITGAPPFPPGVSGNPAGRPKGSRNRSTVLRELMDMVIEGQDLSGVETKLPVETLIMQALVKKAMTGDVAAIKEFQDSVHGKIADKTELTGKDGGPVAVLSESDDEILALHKQKIIDDYLKTKGE